MVDASNDVERTLPAHFIVYDAANPSPLIPEAEIAYIESVSQYLTPAELTWLRQFEWFILNTNTGIVANGEIPGLREEVDTRTIYVKKLTAGNFDETIDVFLSIVPEGFPQEDVMKHYTPLYRVTLPNGDRFYPIKFHGNFDQWRRRLKASADKNDTVLGEFERGKFVVSDGQRFDLSALTVERSEAKGNTVPSSW